MEDQKLFWGLVIEQGKQYKKTPEFNFHVSRAALDLNTVKNESSTTAVYVQVDNVDYLICNLSKKRNNFNTFRFDF